MAKKRFIFDENYIKKHNKDKTKWLIIGVSALIIILIIVIVLIVQNTHKEPEKPIDNTLVFELKEELNLESGSLLPEVVDYFNNLENVNTTDIKIEYPDEFELSYDISACTDEDLERMTTEGLEKSELACAHQNLITPATYGISLYYQEKEYTVMLNVVDTTSPVLMVKDVEIYTNETYKIEDFVSICFDVNGECTLSYAIDDTENITTAGEYEIGIIAEDKYGNKTSEVKAKLTVKEPEKTLYTVSFNTEGGTNVDSIKVEEGSTINEPTTTREGYTFNGWYNNNTKFDFTTPIASDLTLTAKWQKNNTGTSTGGGSTTPTTISVTSISINYSKIYLEPGASKTLTATVTPSNATNKTVTWSSSDNSIATVTNGKITGIKEGTATISATAGGKTTTVEVVVRTVSTCKYGDTKYDTTRFTLSQDVTQNNCAVDPNLNYGTPLAITDHTNLSNTLKGYSSTSINNYQYTRILNTTGTGMVGYQITNTVIVTTTDNKTLTSKYTLKSNGSRVYSINEIGLN